MKYFKRLNPNNSKGDTIVEVLIVLAVLSLAFAISSATASRGLAQSRNAQEHSQALGLLDSQIEQLRTATSADANLSAANVAFCMTGPTNIDTGFASGYNYNADAATDLLTTPDTNYPAACADSSASSFPYYKSIVYRCDATCVGDNGATGYFDLKVRWDGAGNLGAQQENMTYRIHPLTATATSGIPLTGSTSQVVVKERDITPDAGPYGPDTPPCSKTPGSGSHPGINVTLNQIINGSATQSGSTDISGTVTFGSGISDNGIYQVSSVTNLPSDSNGSFNLCAITPSSVQPNGNTKEIDFILQPQCTTRNEPYSYFNAPSFHGGLPDPSWPPQNVVTDYSLIPATYQWNHTGDAYYGSPQGPIIYAQNPPPPNPPWGALLIQATGLGQRGYQFINYSAKRGASRAYWYNFYDSGIQNNAYWVISGYTYSDWIITTRPVSRCPS